MGDICSKGKNSDSQDSEVKTSLSELEAGNVFFSYLRMQTIEPTEGSGSQQPKVKSEVKAAPEDNKREWYRWVLKESERVLVSDDVPVLILACLYNLNDLVSSLLVLGADPTVAFLGQTGFLPIGTTCLHVACEAGNLPLVKLLLESSKRIDVDAMTVAGRASATPLMCAIAGRHYTCALHLMRHGSARCCEQQPMNSAGGLTALHIAALAGDLVGLRLLMEGRIPAEQQIASRTGVSVSTVSSGRSSSLWGDDSPPVQKTGDVEYSQSRSVVEFGSIEIPGLEDGDEMQKGELDTHVGGGDTTDCNTSDTDEGKELKVPQLSRTKSWEDAWWWQIPDASGETPFHAALRSGSVPCIRYLIEAGAAVNGPLPHAPKGTQNDVKCRWSPFMLVLLSAHQSGYSVGKRQLVLRVLLNEAGYAPRDQEIQLLRAMCTEFVREHGEYGAMSATVEVEWREGDDPDTPGMPVRVEAFGLLRELLMRSLDTADPLWAEALTPNDPLSQAVQPDAEK